MLLADSNMNVVETPVLEATSSVVPVSVVTPAPIGIGSTLPADIAEGTALVSPIVPWWLVGIVVVVIIAGVLLFRKYKK